MSWIEWIAFKHPALVHLPIAAALLLPLALLAAQRAGRGIRPWWTTSRYLTWAGWFGILGALASGLASARVSELLPSGAWLIPRGIPELASLRLHQLWAFGSLLLGSLTLLAVSRRRREHQGLGVLGLLFGVCWAVSTVVTAYHGGRVARPERPISRPATVVNSSAPAPVDRTSPRDVPLWIVDYAALEAQHAEPVKSPVHGNRWIRVWVDRASSEAYHAGQPLPAGAKVVMSSVEDRWGRPGFVLGPLYALEMDAAGKPELSLYWPNVPEALRGETAGAGRVYWRGQDPALQGCMECHAQGAAPLKDRSRWRVVRKPQAEDAGETATPAEQDS